MSTEWEDTISRRAKKRMTDRQQQPFMNIPEEGMLLRRIPTLSENQL